MKNHLRHTFLFVVAALLTACADFPLAPNAQKGPAVPTVEIPGPVLESVVVVDDETESAEN